MVFDMARPNFVRMSAVEFDMTRPFVRYDDATMQCLQSCIVGDMTAQDACLKYNLKYATFVTRKRRFWQFFEMLSKSYQTVYGTLPSEMVLYRFVNKPDGDRSFAYRNADSANGYMTDALNQRLSVMAFEQICAFSPIRSNSIVLALRDFFCFGVSYEEAGQKQGITRQAVLHGCKQFYNYIILDEIVQITEPLVRDNNLWVSVLSKDDFVRML